MFPRSSKTAILAATGVKPTDAAPKESLLIRINAFLRERSKLYLLLKSALMDTSRNYFAADLARYKDPHALERELSHRHRQPHAFPPHVASGSRLVPFPYEYQGASGAECAGHLGAATVDRRTPGARRDSVLGPCGRVCARHRAPWAPLRRVPPPRRPDAPIARRAPGRRRGRRGVVATETAPPRAVGTGFSVELEPRFVPFAERWVLRLLLEQAAFDREHLDLRPHETAERILGVPTIRLATHVEARVH